jgi:glycine reductase
MVMSVKRVVHYVNQFYGGLGGEEEANLPPRIVETAVGPGRLLQQALGEKATIVGTVICGDNYINEEPEDAAVEVRQALTGLKPDVVIAGPAFHAGRYGLACGQVCAIARDLDIPAVTAMYPENPGVPEYRLHTYILPTGESPTEMEPAINSLAAFALKLANNLRIGSAYEEGFLPRGIRRATMAAEPASKRAADMLAAKINGRPFKTEIPILVPDLVTPASPLSQTEEAMVAMVTTGGLIPRGNPERQVQGNPERFFRYPIDGLDDMVSSDWEAFHGGYYNITTSENPNYILPLRPMRILENQGVVGGIHPWVWTMPGVGTPVAKAKKFGVQIAQEMVDSEEVDACILVST